MAKAKKLPSGSWRVQVFSYKDAAGKNHYESFTAPTKAEAEMIAAEFKASKDRKSKHDLTVEEAVNGYIQAKDGVLSYTIPVFKKEDQKRLMAVYGEDFVNEGELETLNSMRDVEASSTMYLWDENAEEESDK